ncbi:MAG TPA: hypothetical protein VFX17_03115 [Patescibacteria group bacterium]|nr:hypothetical protein [Patescibacteria group bacterium]
MRIPSEARLARLVELDEQRMRELMKAEFAQEREQSSFNELVLNDLEQLDFIGNVREVRCHTH